jgi:hypothetical protein
LKNHPFLTCLFIIMLLLALMSVATELSTAMAALPVGTTYIESPFTLSKTNSPLNTEYLASNITFLSIVLKNFPLIPAAPELNAISNADGDGNYTVSWSSSEGADTYTLEEDDNIDFSSPGTVYSGSSTSKDLSGRDVGTYYYRVRASYSSVSSDWSNIVSVEVTVPLPDCPQAGEWSGLTDQGGSIHFQVEYSSQCQITNLGIYSLNCFPPYDYFKPVSWSGWVFPIIDNSFITGIGIDRVTGNFGSLTTANGEFSIRWERFVPYYQTCQSTGTWMANP